MIYDSFYKYSFFLINKALSVNMALFICNIFAFRYDIKSIALHNSKINQILCEAIYLSLVNRYLINYADRITSSHYALLFGDIHVLQRVLQFMLELDLTTWEAWEDVFIEMLILIENWNVFTKEELLGIFG